MTTTEAGGWFRAFVRIAGRRIRLGVWPTEAEAALAHDRAALALGADVPLNSPKEARRLGAATPEELRVLAAGRMRAIKWAERSPDEPYTGVRLLKSGRWEIRDAGGGRAVGTFATAREAAIARDRVLLWMGITDRLNEPDAARALGPLDPDEARRLSRLERRATATSRYFGVTFNEQAGHWIAVVRENWETMTIGHFATEEAAAMAHDRVARGLGRTGKDQLNFPRRRLTPSTLDEERERLRRSFKATCSSRYNGVNLARSIGSRKWQARYTLAHEQHELGSWRTERDAAVAYDRAALHFGAAPEDLNLPDLSIPLHAASPQHLREQAWAEFKQTTTSRFRGVSWVSQHQCWTAAIMHERRTIQLGRFQDEVRAAEAYDVAALRLHGPRAKPNFP